MLYSMCGQSWLNYWEPQIPRRFGIIRIDGSTMGFMMFRWRGRGRTLGKRTLISKRIRGVIQWYKSNKNSWYESSLGWDSSVILLNRTKNRNRLEQTGTNTNKHERGLNGTKSSQIRPKRWNNVEQYRDL